MTYAETLEYMYAQLPMFHRIGAQAYKKDLGNTLALCEMLGSPQHRFKSVHVAGTNGKGSVSHLLSALCQAQGLKTGLYISPHYKDFRERIKVDGQYIPRKRVVAFIARYRARIEEIQPSFFEICVALAFDHFARERVDVAIIEVGLGGRLDSTNIITPLLSVITNISYDHQNLLGDTLPLIASEKAGIIKPGIPVVVGETQAESAPVFLEKAATEQSDIYFADQHCRAVEIGENADKNAVYDVQLPNEKQYIGLETGVAGPFQEKNIATALYAWEQLQTRYSNLFGTEDRVREALRNLRPLTRFQGRWQYIGRRPDILCDSAHNEAGLQVAFARIRNMRWHRLHVVCGFVNDKSVEKILPFFPQEASYFFAKADIPRGLDVAVLQEKAAAWGLRGRTYKSVRYALRAAKRQATADDLIVVIGSIFVVAEVI
jgi:dihydrofolate synthase / folylpolyglutamate synthase